AEVTWPAGTYGLPKAKNGCPVSLKTNWTTGWRFEDLEDTRPGTRKSKSYHLDTKVGVDVNRTFCIKAKNNVSTEWPQGQYCIFKKGNCPKGLKKGYVFWDDEDDKNINKKGGTLPDGIYDKDTLVYYCCRTDGDKYTPISLPVISPFYLKAFNTPECQRVKGAIATKEFIRFDTEDTRNKDRQNGSYPYGAGIANHLLLYCYYESCQFTYSLNGIRDEQIEFTSPKFYDDGYPLSQKCTWRFAAPEKKEVHIEFLEMDIENGDVIKIYKNWKSDGSVWAIDNKNPPKVEGYGSARFLLMEFQSRKPDSSKKKSKGFRGVFKVKGGGELPPSGVEWPSGTFGIPRPRLGCPRSKNVTWSTGWRFQDTEDVYPNNYHSQNFHMNSSVMKDDVNRTFCIATENIGKKSWPKGQYCIYKRGTCPKGLTEGYIFFDDENRKNLNKMGGVLPDGEYTKDTKLFYCCRTDGDKAEPISLPISSPFYLLAYNNSECQQVNGALATKEFIRFDNEDTGNKDAKGGTYPHAYGNLIISYCYYEACHFTVSATSQEFMSPSYATGGYPSSQLCTWRFLVQESNPPTEQVLIKFPEFNLQKGGDGDVVKIYSGWDEKAPLLAEFSGDRPPPAKGVAFKSPVVFLVFRSDSRGKSKGFRGLFVNQPYDATAVPKHPITLPYTSTIKPSKNT
ncbi:unnamed protein product, partial [Porites lobata]